MKTLAVLPWHFDDLCFVLMSFCNFLSVTLTHILIHRCVDLRILCELINLKSSIYIWCIFESYIFSTPSPYYYLSFNFDPL